MPAKVKRLAAKQLKKEISFGLLSIKTDWPVNCVPYYPECRQSVAASGTDLRVVCLLAGGSLQAISHADTVGSSRYAGVSFPQSRTMSIPTTLIIRV